METPASVLLESQRAAFLREGPPSLELRRGHLNALKKAVQGHGDSLAEAISEDFGHRSRQETAGLELMPVIRGIGHLQQHLKRWMRPERREVALAFRPGSNRVMYQPLGGVGIVAPWNYPVALALVPLATALAAGNRVMLKPSELTPATSARIATLLGEIFPADHVAVVMGDAAVSAAFSRMPFDHLLFTGSTAVGREVMRAASVNLVPVTLELGGKSPVIIERGSCLETAARRIAWGKLANAGQTCIAPDYVLVAEEEVAAFLAAFEAATLTLYPDIAGNPDYTTIVSDRHFQRLSGLVDDARAKGARIRRIGEGAATTHPRTFLPVLLTQTSDAMAVMQEEIFGPILPVISYQNLDGAVNFINARPRPLALYFFGPDGPARRQVLERTISGGVAINDTLLHYAQDELPFGGVGASGMGAYHGREGFRTLSHAKGVFEQSRFNFMNIIRPPFGQAFERAMKFLSR